MRFPSTTSQNAERLATFREQMADYARGERLKELREKMHASQEAVAFEVGVSTKTLRAWEHGGKIKWENALRIASFYAVDPEALVSREALSDPLGDDGPITQLDRIEEKLDLLLAATGQTVGEGFPAPPGELGRVARGSQRTPQVPRQRGKGKAGGSPREAAG